MEDGMKLTFVHAPVTELRPAIAFYRDTLGWSEAWREGEDTVAFALPRSDVQVMVVAKTDEPPGPMYRVDDVADFLAARPGLQVTIAPYDIPDGTVAGFQDPSGNTLYVFDQARA
jgi:predicted enzyme related to lactoylglutathione lyase